MDRTLKNLNGFTLVELIIVVAITLIIMSIAINKFTGISKAATKNNDIHTLSTFLKSQKLHAFTQKEKINILISDDGQKFTARYDATGEQVKSGSISLKTPIVSKKNSYSINSRGLFSQGTTFYLDSDSTSSEYSCIRIHQARIRYGVWNGKSCKQK